MQRRGLRSRGLAVLLVTFLGFFGAPLEAQSVAAGGRLLKREPNTFPFSAHAAWLEFMGTSPEPLDLTMLSESYPAAKFDSLVRGEGAIAERIVYLSDGLRIRGLLTRPTRPGPHPIVIYNRGGNREFGRLVFLDVLRIVMVRREISRWLDRHLR